MSMRSVGRWRILFWCLFAGFISYHAIRHYRHSDRNVDRLAYFTEDFTTSDFQAWWRASLRLHANPDEPGARPVFFTMGEREENPGKPPPAFYTFLDLFAPLGSRLGAVVFFLLSGAALAASIQLGRKIVSEALAETAISPVSTTRLARVPAEVFGFLILIPFVHLCARYNQLAFVQVYLILQALVLRNTRPASAGLLIAACIVIKPILAPLLPLLIWKQAYRMATFVVVGLVASCGMVALDIGWSQALALHVEWYRSLTSDPSFGGYHERYQSLWSLFIGSVTPVFQDQLHSPVATSPWDGTRNFAASEWLFQHARPILLSLTALIGLACAFAIRRCPTPDSLRRWLYETGFVLATIVLVLPTTWKHYYWYLFPALLGVMIDVRDTKTQAKATKVLLASLLLLTLPHRALPRAVWEPFHVFHGFAIGCAALCVGMFLRLRRETK